MIDTINKICKLRDAPGSFVLHSNENMAFVNSTYDGVVDTQFHKAVLVRQLIVKLLA